jgi:hypothetical protein
MNDEEGADQFDSSNEAGATKMAGLSKEKLVESIVVGLNAAVVSPNPSGCSPVLPNNIQVDNSLVFGTFSPAQAEKQPGVHSSGPAQVIAPSEPIAPTSSSPDPEDDAFVTLFRG